MTITDTLHDDLAVLSLNQTDTANLVAAVKATALAASTDAGRPILTNMLLEVSEGCIKFIATNSYMLIVTEIAGLIDMPLGYKVSFMIKVKPFLAALPKARAMCQLDINPIAKVLTISDVGLGKHTQLRMEEGTYPDYRNLMKGCDEVVNEVFTVGLNPKYLADIGKAAGLFITKSEAKMTPLEFKTGATMMKPVFFNANVMDRGRFFAMLMPMRMR